MINRQAKKVMDEFERIAPERVLALIAEIRTLRWERDRLRNKHKLMSLLCAFLVIILIIFCILPLFASATTIIGDSHVGGLKPYLSKYMNVRYKNGSTSAYWLKQPAYRTDTLIIHTGTNEQFNGTSAKKWLQQTKALCARWNAYRCFIVAPPANRRGNYLAYRYILKSQRNVIYTMSSDMRDAVHYRPSGYKQMARQILYRIKSN